MLSLAPAEYLKDNLRCKDVANFVNVKLSSVASRDLEMKFLNFLESETASIDSLVRQI